MKDLLTPDVAQRILDRGAMSEIGYIPRLCRDYLTLWDELANERSISDRLLERIAELEKERHDVCKTAKVRKHLSGTDRTFLDYP